MKLIPLIGFNGIFSRRGAGERSRVGLIVSRHAGCDLVRQEMNPGDLAGSRRKDGEEEIPDGIFITVYFVFVSLHPHVRVLFPTYSTFLGLLSILSLSFIHHHP